MSARRPGAGVAHITLAADRVAPGPLVLRPEGLVQESHLWLGGQLVCVLRATFPPGSPEWERFQPLRTLDGMGLRA